MKRHRLVILTEIISPYRIPLFNALAEHSEMDLRVIFLAETDPVLRQWKVYKEEIQFSYQILPSWRKQLGRYNLLLNRDVARSLTAASPNAILCGGYNYAASWQALAWARSRKIPFLLWSESHLHELRRSHALVEFLKAEFLSRCDGFVVPGQAAREYLIAHKIKPEVIFTAPNAVDNDLFATAAAKARQDASASRKALDLPERYFLFAGRLVRAKGVFELLTAYAKLDEQLRQQVGLVFAGDGTCRQELELKASAVSPGIVRFAGFAHREQLAAYYALAEMLVLPTYTDTWGLVVNEAMACGLPIILSSAAGCAPDLVKEDWNGLIVPSMDVPALTSAMNNLATRPEVRRMMGANGACHISLYSPRDWSEAIFKAMQLMAGARD
jgi:glycosyltransferase involved in cell wall biosynthesis